MRKNTATRTVLTITVLATALGSVCVTLTGCGSAALQRRAEVVQPSGANETLDERFGLSADAQDPSERDKELGYGRWKGKPEAEGTRDPRAASRRGETWTPGK